MSDESISKIQNEYYETETLDSIAIWNEIKHIEDALEILFSSSNDGIAPIVQTGHPALRQWTPKYEFEISKSKFDKLIDIMEQTMKNAPGVGLAAPQIGLPLNIAVAEDMSERDENDDREFSPLKFVVLINPEYKAFGFSTKTFYEGCLSLSGYSAMRRRFHEITYSHQDSSGELVKSKLSGWPARIIQHESDHLKGELYIDKSDITTMIDGRYF